MPGQIMNDASRVAHTLAALRALGLERVESADVALDAVYLDAKAWQVTAERPAMGTLVSLVALGSSRDQLEEAVTRSLESMQRLIGVLTRYDASSPVSHLNATGRLLTPPPELRDVLSTALEYHRLTQGTFDVSVAPLVDLFRDRLVRASPVEPTAVEVAEAISRVGGEHIALSRRRIDLGRHGMRLTLDGIAKGYIVDAISAVLDRALLHQRENDAATDGRNALGNLRHNYLITLKVFTLC